MSIPWTRLPFGFTDTADYRRRLSAWIGEVFYERLPAAGYQVREEQIHFAFRVGTALAAGDTLLAEAGSGTGKTFGYLLSAVCHARLTGRPVAVATATAALQQQLAGPEGDIATLSRLLELGIDCAVARRPQEALCDIKLERFSSRRERRRGRARLIRQAAASAHGARSDFPDIPDTLWREVAWDGGCRCDACPRRGYCRLTQGRRRAREAADLVVCDHDLFFEDTFRRERLPPGRLPALPPLAGVIFDEGHRVAAAAQRAAGGRLHPRLLEGALDACEGEGVRLRLLRAVDIGRTAARGFAEALAGVLGPDDGTRRAVDRSAELTAAAQTLDRILGTIGDEAAVEEGLQAETPYALRLPAAQTELDEARLTLHTLADPAWIPWWEDGALWTAPRDLGPWWRRHLPARLPLVFSSATLLSGGSAAYASTALGLKGIQAVRVGVPFRLARQVLCYLPSDLPAADDPGFWAAVAARLDPLLQATGGRALLLLPDAADMRRLRALWPAAGARVAWEGDGASEALVAAFTRDVGSCLVAHSLWEGVDVPGESLSAVIVPRLPWPGQDPLLAARRTAALQAGEDPRAAVDVPAMTLRLKQGLGRLIRTENDAGVLALLDPQAKALPGLLDDVLPQGARRVVTLPPVRRFLRQR